MKHNKILNTLQKRTINAIVESTTIDSIDAISKTAANILDALIAENARVFPVGDYGLLIAYTLSRVAQKALESKIISVREYIALFAAEKAKAFYATEHSDYGAFGDLYEILVRLCFLKNINLASKAHLHVAELRKIDLTSKKYGKIEIAQNGKTLQEGTINDYMNGNYTSFIYGVFDAYTQKVIFDYCINGDVENAIKTIKAYSIICDKYAFIPTLQKYRRGAIITVKSSKVMIQYNASLYNCVIRAIENGDFATLETI